MIKKITTIASTNKKAFAKKVLIVGGIAAGLVAGALLVKPDEDVVIGEVVDGSFTISKNPEKD